MRLPGVLSLLGGLLFLASSTWAETLSYTNVRVAREPWSIHVVRVPRTEAAFELRSAHAGEGATGLSPLSTHLARAARPGGATAVAAINGDYYQRDRAYAGDPRGLQIVNGEVISAPNGSPAFWIDPRGEPISTNVVSRFEAIWPDGRRSPIGLNGERHHDQVQLYSAAVGASTRTVRGRELVLEPAGPDEPWLPLAMGIVYRARVREVRETGDTPIAPGTLVLSLGPQVARSMPKVEPGAVVRISTASVPDLAGVRTAIGGGPVLVRGGRRQKIVPPDTDSYEATSMHERHPRSAIGWNATHYFLIEVDGRQKPVSDGMTLEEFGAWIARWGCREAMNLDGGGSATLWYEGRVVNSPCDGRERPIANSLVVVRKPGETATTGAP